MSYDILEKWSHMSIRPIGLCSSQTQVKPPAIWQRFSINILHFSSFKQQLLVRLETASCCFSIWSIGAPVINVNHIYSQSLENHFLPRPLPHAADARCQQAIDMGSDHNKKQTGTVVPPFLECCSVFCMEILSNNHFFIYCCWCKCQQKNHQTQIRLTPSRDSSYHNFMME